MISNLIKKILVVEDDKTTSQILYSFIINLGYDIYGTVTSGELALNLISKNRPDLILMDVTLEGNIDGIETAKIINNLYNIPVVYITSSSDTDTIERLKETNPFGFIIKPIDKKELKSCIEMAFLRFKMEQNLIENEEKLSTILNSIGDAVIVINQAGLITYTNQVAKKILGKENNEILGIKLDEIIKIEHNIPITDDYEIKDFYYDYLILKDRKQIPVNYSVAPIKNAAEEVSGAVIVIRDDTDRMNAQHKINESFIHLRKAMSGIIQAMAHTLETRDPYTAGHQRRVSDLAREIATEMKLSKNIIESIRMSGIIHDLGKISIPAEILSKPGKLSDIEFSLMKTHPQTGYDILKNIEFPWAIADIIYQHHEKLDGSGYPLGLMSNNILLEAKILTVADVVEAMASHRPYRAALGIDFALNEISKFKGIYYDSDVVDICVSIFKDKGYIMKFD